MQLAAQRIALNLHEAGFNVQMAAPGARLCGFDSAQAAAAGSGSCRDALEQMMRSAGEPTPGDGKQHPLALFKVEQRIWTRRSSFRFLICRVPMRAGRVRDLHLRADGTPDLADASLEDTP